MSLSSLLKECERSACQEVEKSKIHYICSTLSHYLAALHRINRVLQAEFEQSRDFSLLSVTDDVENLTAGVSDLVETWKERKELAEVRTESQSYTSIINFEQIYLFEKSRFLVEQNFSVVWYIQNDIMEKKKGVGDM